MIRFSALEEHERAGATEEARIQHEIRVQNLQNGLTAARRAGEMLNSPMYTERVERDSKGVVVAEIKEPTRWTFDTAKKMYEMGALAAGEPTSRSDVTGRAEQDFDHANNAAADAALDAFLDAVTRGAEEADGPGATGRSELE
jgi:hypothetical protein